METSRKPRGDYSTLVRSLEVSENGIEIKASATLTSRDGQGLVRIAERCGADFQQGILLYDGNHVLPMRDERLLAVPLRELWER